MLCRLTPRESPAFPAVLALTPALPQFWGAAGLELCGPRWHGGAHWGWAELSLVLVSGECAESCSEGLALGDTEVQQLQCWAVPVAAGAGRGSDHVCGCGGGQVRAEGLGLG